MTFLQLVREANRARLPLFTNEKGERYHDGIDGDEWTLDQWFNAVLGELGELANKIKKLERGDTIDKQSIAFELADTFLYFDIYMLRVGVELDDCPRFLVGYGWPPVRHTRRLARILGLLAGLRPGDENTRPLCKRFVRQLCLLAADLRIDFEGTVVRKFNLVSERRGLPVRITPHGVVAE